MSRDSILSAAAAALALAACVLAAAGAGRGGLGRLVADYALASGRLDAAEAAARLSPADAETHYARAVLLADAGRAGEAADEYERAASLRPRDYALWLGLGAAREEAGDAEGAVSAFTTAAREAPYYAEPRWQLGNVLLRAGRRDEALGELRRAAEADPSLYQNFVEIAWHKSGGDAPSFISLAAPPSADARLLVARFLVARAEPAAAIELARAAGDLDDARRRALLADLISAGDFVEAHDLRSSWGGRGAAGAVEDGGFERVAGFDDDAFGWRLAPGDGAFGLSLDAADPREGARSLRIDFRGGPAPQAEIASQLVLVEPGARYRLSFAARAHDLLTGGPPLARILDAKNGATLAESQAVPTGETDGWREFGAEFTTPAATPAVRVVVTRRPCAEPTCPVFGQLWLDDFRLQKL